MTRALIVMLGLFPPLAGAATSQTEIDYMLHCRGCHGQDGEAHPRVPALRGNVAALMRVPGGREYLVRVPGVARAALDDDRLAELLDWVVARFGEGDYAPYSAAEVAPLRAAPLVDPTIERARLLAR